MKPGEVLSMGGAVLLLYLMTKGLGKSEAKEQERSEKEEKSVKKKEAKEEAKEVLHEQITDVIKLHDPKTGKYIRTINLDTIAEEIREALYGSVYSEDEERAIKAILLAPAVIAAPGGKYWYPIQRVALRFAAKTNNLNLKSELTRLLSAADIARLSKYLIYI